MLEVQNRYLTDYGQHGDDVFGWKGDALQRAMDVNGCFSVVCGKQETQDITVANKFTIPKTVVKDFDGCKWTSSYSICLKVA